jgi:hypothetical protein
MPGPSLPSTGPRGDGAARTFNLELGSSVPRNVSRRNLVVPGRPWLLFEAGQLEVADRGRCLSDASAAPLVTHQGLGGLTYT